MRRVFDNTISTALATVLLAACRLLLVNRRSLQGQWFSRNL